MTTDDVSADHPSYGAGYENKNALKQAFHDAFIAARQDSVTNLWLISFRSPSTVLKRRCVDRLAKLRVHASSQKPLA